MWSTPILKAAETTKGVGQVINIANGERITLNQLLHELKGLTKKPDVVADYQGPRAGDVKHSLGGYRSRDANYSGFEPRVDLAPRFAIDHRLVETTAGSPRPCPFNAITRLSRFVPIAFASTKACKTLNVW